VSVQTKPRRWDPVVKLTHWSIALAVLANAVVTEEGSAAHVWVGYALASILGLRLLWGLVGPAEAHFSAFPPSPRKALAHVSEIRARTASEHASHNPLGALMVYAIWSCLLVIIGTGIAMAGLPGADERQDEGGRAAYAASLVDVAQGRDEEADRGAEQAEHAEEEGEHEEGPLTEVHEVAANLLYLLILLHIAGVVFETRRSGRQVVLAMLPGRR
jgi:cytochrome b